MFSKRSIFTSLGLAIIVAVTNYLSLQSIRQNTKALGKNHVTGIASGVTFSQMSLLGKKTYWLQASSATRYSSGKTRFESVQGKALEPAPSPPWQIKADHAWSYPQNKKIHLWGNVIAWRDATLLSTPIKLATQALTLFPHQDLISTPEFVTISEPGTHNITTAVGLKAHPKKRTLSLLSKVHSYYEPSKPGHKNA